MNTKPPLFGLRHDYMKYFSKDSPRVRLMALFIIVVAPPAAVAVVWVLFGR